MEDQLVYVAAGAALLVLPLTVLWIYRRQRRLPQDTTQDASERFPDAVTSQLKQTKLQTNDGTDKETRLLQQRLTPTRKGFTARLAAILHKSPTPDQATFDAIEELLLSADVGSQTVHRLVERSREQLKAITHPSTHQWWTAIRDEAKVILKENYNHPSTFGDKKTIVLMVGVNGVGKTTTIGKLASHLKAQEKKILLAAGDTYRAAAAQQLEVWGKRVNCQVIKGSEGADPSSVAFEAIKQAKIDSVDVTLVDSAGRLHTRTPLMDELKKIYRTIQKANDGQPADEVFLVVDATTGQNALQQAKIFQEAVPVSGVILTKLDGSAKGGVILNIAEQYKLPIRYIGVGETIDDLRIFNPDAYIDALFDENYSDDPEHRIT